MTSTTETAGLQDHGLLEFVVGLFADLHCGWQRVFFRQIKATHNRGRRTEVRCRRAELVAIAGLWAEHEGKAEMLKTES